MSEKRKPMTPDELKLQAEDVLAGLKNGTVSAMEGSSMVGALNCFLNIVKTQVVVARHNAANETAVDFVQPKKKSAA